MNIVELMADLEDAASNKRGPREEELALTTEEATRLLELGGNPYGLKVGDMVVPSPQGSEKQRFPKAGTNQLLKVTAVYDAYRASNTEGNVCFNGQVTVAIAPNTVNTYEVDLRDFQRAE